MHPHVFTQQINMPGFIQSVVFQMDSYSRKHQRSVYNLLDFIGDVGGLLDGLRFLFSLLVLPVSSFTFTSTLLSKLFEFAHEERAETGD